MPQIKVDCLAKSFGFVTALKNISFSIEPGEDILLLGANGAGKSTLIYCLAGLLRPDQGSITYTGSVKPRIGLVTQNSFLYGDLTVKENLELFAKLAITEGKSIQDQVRELLAIFSLEAIKNKKIKECSLGTARRASIARALIVKPEVILLDEPYSNLDPKGREELKKVLTEHLSQGVSMLVATNDPDIIEVHNGKVLALRHGVLIADEKIVGIDNCRTEFLRAIY